MNFDFTRGPADDQGDGARAARGPLAVRARARGGRGRRHDDALWRELCELGWPGIAVAEEHGGQGLGAVELAVLLEELGYAVAADAVPRHACSPPLAIAHAGDDEQRARWLPGLRAGELTGGFGGARARRRRARRRRARARRRRGGAAGARARRRRRRAARRDRPDARATAASRGDGRAAAAATWRARWTAAAAAIAAELVGVCQRALDMTVAYVYERKPVRRAGRLVPGGRAPLRADAAAHRGRALGGLLRGLGGGRRAGAAGRGRRPRPRGRGGAGDEVTGSAIQAHGGIGFTWEADVHWLFKRAQLDAALLGGGSAARIALARLVAGPAQSLGCRGRHDPSSPSPPRTGRGGSAIGPLVAEQLGVPFLDRAIPVAVAERLDVSERDACERDESDRLLALPGAALVRADGPVLGGTEPAPRSRCRRVLRGDRAGAARARRRRAR